MNEKEKMLACQPYFSADATLLEERENTKDILFRLNALHPRATQEKNELLTQLFHRFETDSVIELPFRCDYGYNISIGHHFFANYNCTFLDCAPITIGNNVFFAPNVSLFTAGHPLDFEPRNEGIEYALPITIGDNVWIGGGVIINPGVSIGSNVVIGSGSVVTKNIPSNVIAVGNPCKVIREIREEDKTDYIKKYRL